jgi:hypothetical protein
MTARVRDFLYLDHTLVAQTLSQLDFGVFKEWEETLARATDKDGRAAITLWGAANIGAGTKSSATAGTSVVLQQTAESYAARLLVRLEEENQLTRLEADTVAALRRGSVIASEGIADDFDYNRFDAEGWSPEVMTRLYDLHSQSADLERPGVHPPEHVKAATLIRTGDMTVVASFLPGHLRVPIQELLGESVEMVGSVRRAFGLTPSQPKTLLIVRPIAVY